MRHIPLLKPLVLVTVAAVLLASSAEAAKRYLITSSSQISPKVLKKLRGRTGPTGPAGRDGAPGAQGQAGQTGATGPAGPTASAAGTGTFGQTLTAITRTTVATTSITVPAGAAALVINGDLSWTSSSATTLFCIVRVDGNDLNGEVDDQVAANAVSTVAINKRVAVGAGPHTVDLRCQAGATSTSKGADVTALATG